MRKFQPRRYRPGNLGTWSGHLAFARDLVETLRPALLVELGTHFGESYFGFCQAIEEGAFGSRCYAVDTWKGDPHAGFYDETVFEDVQRYNTNNYAAFSSLLRSTFDDACAHFAQDSIDLLHIDGLHTYEAVRRDFENWFPKVRPGGIVLLHDVAVRHADFEVWRFWEELQQSHRCFTFNHWWGLGVLQKKGGPHEQPVEQPDLLKLLFASSREEQQAVRAQYVLAAEHLDFSRREQVTVSLNASRIDTAKPTLQVFAGRLGGYSEDESVRSQLHPEEWQTHSLTLDKGAGPAPLRIDPANCPCLIELKRITIKDALSGDLVHSLSDPASLRNLACDGDLMCLAGSGAIRFFSYGTDPWFTLPLPANTRDRDPLFIEIEMRMSLDLSSIGSIIRQGARFEGEAALSARQTNAALEDLRCQHEMEAALSKRLSLESESFQQELAKQREAMVDQEAEFERLRSAHSLVAEDARRLQAMLQSCKEESRKWESLAHRESAACQEYLASYSWRITAPLRAIFGFFNK